MAFQRTDHRFVRKGRGILSGVVAGLSRKDRSHTALVEEAAGRMGPLLVACVVRSLLDYSNRPVVHEENAPDCNHAGCSHEEVDRDGRSTHLRQVLHIGHVVESVDDSFCPPDARPESVGRSA